MDLGLSGLASGFDWRSLIDQLLQVERAPQRTLLSEQDKLDKRNIAYGALKTELGILSTRVDAINDEDLFDSRSASVGNTALFTASAAAGSPLGTYTFNVTQMASSAIWKGASDAGAALSATNDVSTLTLSNAGFSSDVTAGVFTVNGKQITIATTDTLKGVFDKIAAATGDAVTGAYDAATDKITLTGTGTITLGSATDTSNFLEIAKLYNNGGSSITSNSALGAVRIGKALSSANFATAVSDGGSGAGSFKINGVAISFNASTDTLSSVMDRINNSTAGVLAAYDPTNDRITLTNKSTGDVGISVEDVTGNFAAATKLSTGSLTRGQNLLYTLNGGSQLVSQSNTISAGSSGVTGLTVSVLQSGSSTVTVSADTAKIKTAITDFISEYNKVQSLIESQTSSTTDQKGKVTAGILASEGDASDIASKLRSLIYSKASGMSGLIDHVDDLGIVSNGNDNSLSISDNGKLDSALAGNLSSVKEFFTHASAGIGTLTKSYLDKTIGDEGTLISKQDLLTRQSSDIDTQISDMEKLVLAHKDQLTASFVAMETAQAQINQQINYLTSRFK